MKAHLLLLVLLLLAGGVFGASQIDYGASTGDTDVTEVEVPFGQAVPGSTLGLNNTNASVTLTGSLLSVTDDALYLNNTNTSGTWFVRLELVDSTELTNLDLLEVGIDDGTTQTSQVEALLGNLTQSTGTPVELAASSTNTIYVTHQLLSLATTSEVVVDVYVAVDSQESAFHKMRATITLD